MLSKKIITGIFTLIIFSILTIPIYARDLSEDFTIVSSEYAETVNYKRMDPPFSMSVPKGWYLAYLNEDVPGIDRAFFCKDDPTKGLSQGLGIDMPYIKVAFLPNPDGVAAEVPADNQVLIIQEAGGDIMTYEKVLIDDQVGTHFTSSVPGEAWIMDTYIATLNNVFFSIKAVCKDEVEFKEIKPKIKEAIDSIKFSTF